MLNKFQYKALYSPVTLVFLPVFLVAGIFSIELKTFLPVAFGTLFPFIIPFFMIQTGGTRGKALEKGLWQEWGGMPSVQMLRWRDKTINTLTKTRIHQKLQQICPVPLPPTEAMEFNDSLQADEVYETWSDHVRMNTRDTNVYPMLFMELINYNFRRNMLGLKGTAFFVIILLMAALYGGCAGLTHSFNPLNFPPTFFYALIGLILIMIIWLSVVKKSWVRKSAIGYALQLYESALRLSNLY